MQSNPCSTNQILFILILPSSWGYESISQFLGFLYGTCNYFDSAKVPNKTDGVLLDDLFIFLLIKNARIVVDPVRGSIQFHKFFSG